MKNTNDEACLASFEQKLQLIRDRVRGVTERYYCGCYLVGRPGTSKTFTVEEELKANGVQYVLRNARMTPMGLFEFLHDHPEHVIVLDDIASLFRQQAALQILMAALDGDPGQPRTVTYKSKDKSVSFQFMGGVIAISNLPLKNDPLANALASRVQQVEHEPSDEEIAAFMRMLAADGHKDLCVETCHEVVEFVIQETRNLDRRLDLRHMRKAFEDRRQYEHGHSQTDWQDLIRTSLAKSLSQPAGSKREQKEQIVRDVVQRFPGDWQRQVEESGISKSTLFRIRDQLGLSS